MKPAATIPCTTYRLQFRKDFSFISANEFLPYFCKLGITDLYFSPIFTAQPGSIHGYDVTNHSQLNPELGDQVSLYFFLNNIAKNNLRFLLDIVPNHMSITGDHNPLWLDVLENGPTSPYANHFDIDWNPSKPELVGKVLLPFLNEQYGHALEDSLSIGYQDKGFFLQCEGYRLPLSPFSWRYILEVALENLSLKIPTDHTLFIELESILRALVYALPAMRSTEDLHFFYYRREAEAIRWRLLALQRNNQVVEEAILFAINLINGTKGVPKSYNKLEKLLADQWYRLTNWRVAAHEINYRRFFDINDLAAIRIEIPAVFKRVHELAFTIAKHTAFSGFRIDHLDGLFDPEQYLEDLSSHYTELNEHSDLPYVVVEKILGHEEELPDNWQAHGTTGYDFISIMADLFTFKLGAIHLQENAFAFCKTTTSFSDIAYESKRLVLQTTLAAELSSLAKRLDHISEQHRYSRDFTLNQLHAALGEVISCFSVYRTYFRKANALVRDEDYNVIIHAISEARKRNQLIHASLFDFIQSVLLRNEPPGITEAEHDERNEFLARLQQTTSPVFAKGVEDTAFYRYPCLIAHNEVGSDPQRMGATREDIHQTFLTRSEHTPFTLSATATHDTKRGEDTRTRLYVLSERWEAWKTASNLWSRLNLHYKTRIDAALAPTLDEEYFLYQTLVGSWPVDGLKQEPQYRQRIRSYMTKARHEAKLKTSWINPNHAYETAADEFISKILDPAQSYEFLQSIETFIGLLVYPGFYNSLSQIIIKIAAPGIPDFYQGTELWDFSLVDPDNRKLIDYAYRAQLIDSLFIEYEKSQLSTIQSWFKKPQDGRIKMWVTAMALQLRKRQSQLFLHGEYHSLALKGMKQDHIFSFFRTNESDCVITIAGRFFALLGYEPPLGNVWDDTQIILPQILQGHIWKDALTGITLGPYDKVISISEAFSHLPIALLERVT